MTPYKVENAMVVNPTQEYTLTELQAWFEQAQGEGKTLVIDPCNPGDVPYLQTWASVDTRDDMAVLTQWLGGLKE